jgi:hypothetical protein
MRSLSGASALAYQEIEVTNAVPFKAGHLEGRMPPPCLPLILSNIDMCAEIDTDDEMNRV